MVSPSAMACRMASASRRGMENSFGLKSPMVKSATDRPAAVIARISLATRKMSEKARPDAMLERRAAAPGPGSVAHWVKLRATLVLSDMLRLCHTPHFPPRGPVA